MAKQQLCLFHGHSLGSIMRLPLRIRVFRKLLEFIQNKHREKGYLEVEKGEFGSKHTSCHLHCSLFGHQSYSYRDLPVRVVDHGILQMNECSNPWLKEFQQHDTHDTHTFCRESQLTDEIKGILDFISYGCKIFGFTYDLELSTRPEIFVGNLETWRKAEVALIKALNEFGKPWKEKKGDGACYGPKIDINVTSAMQGAFHFATLQVDFHLPSHFNLSYTSEETKGERFVMIHSAVHGSLSQMTAVLFRHYEGNWPFWLSPRQAIVCSFNSQNSKQYALEVRNKIFEAGYNVDVNTSDRLICDKIHEAKEAQYKYVILAFVELAHPGQVTVLPISDGPDELVMSVEDLLSRFKREAAAFY